MWCDKLHVNRFERGGWTFRFVRGIWNDEAGQDIAEYAVMLAVIFVLVVGTIRLVGSSANTAFSAAASSLQWQAIAEGVS